MCIYFAQYENTAGCNLQPKCFFWKKSFESRTFSCLQYGPCIPAYAKKMLWLATTFHTSTFVWLLSVRDSRRGEFVQIEPVDAWYSNLGTLNGELGFCDGSKSNGCKAS